MCGKSTKKIIEVTMSLKQQSIELSVVLCTSFNLRNTCMCIKFKRKSDYSFGVSGLIVVF